MSETLRGCSKSSYANIETVNSRYLQLVSHLAGSQFCCGGGDRGKFTFSCIFDSSVRTNRQKDQRTSRPTDQRMNEGIKLLLQYHLGGKKRDSCLKQHLLQKSASPKRIKLKTSTWSHYEDLTQILKMGPIWGLQLYSFRSSTLLKLLLLLAAVAFLSAKIVASKHKCSIICVEHGLTTRLKKKQPHPILS